jgi:hypothetical protein
MLTSDFQNLSCKRPFGYAEYREATVRLFTNAPKMCGPVVWGGSDQMNLLP